MIEVLYFSDKDVKRRLVQRVGSSPRWTLVTATRHRGSVLELEKAEPFRSLEAQLGDFLDQVLMADEGKVEGMWRDPVGDLADSYYPHDRARAYAAATGYLLIYNGKLQAVVRKSGRAVDDVWFIHQGLSEQTSDVPRPDPATRPGMRSAPKRPAARAPFTRPSHKVGPTPRAVPPQQEPPRAPPNSMPPPWAVLGISVATPLPEAKKAFRALIAQYHPDKVAHLAPEFQELAERRTRQLLQAWEALKARDGDSGA